MEKGQPSAAPNWEGQRTASLGPGGVGGQSREAGPSTVGANSSRSRLVGSKMGKKTR
jgi:hypothetical protein